MSLWNSFHKDYSERVPLSAHDNEEDEEEPPLPPYTDNPDTPSRSSSYLDNNPPQDQDASNGAAVHRRVNGRSSGAPASAHKAITVNGGYDNVEDDEDDPGFGEGDFYRNGSGDNHNLNSGDRRMMYSSTPSKHKRNKPTRYRTGLICAYLRYWLTCCGACIGGRVKSIFMCLFYMLLFVTILVCASAIGYIIARDGSPFVPDDDVVDSGTDNISGGGAYVAPTLDNGGGKTFDKQINATKLPPPPSNLHDICSDWITESGRKKCETECSVADCCSMPATNKNSCWEEQAEECATYRAACMALELHKDDGNAGSGSSGVIGPKTILYAPPSNLSVVCSATSLATPEGFDQCADLCRPSRCCYPDNFDCNLADDRYCDDYEDLCASVAESWRGSGHAVVPSSTASSTSTSSGGKSSTVDQAPAIANGVMTKCNAANLNPPDECVHACWPGACCYVSTSYPPIVQLFDQYYGAGESKKIESCASSVGYCQQYGSCEHLNHMKDVAGWNSDEINYVVDVSTPCKNEHIAQFGALECSNVCQPAHCCFSGEYECDDVQLGHLSCEDYKACEVLYPGKKTSTKELLKLAERIDDVCSASSLNTIGGLAECKDVCNDHLCCFYQDGCTNDPDKNCIAYAGCESYYNLPTGGGQTGTNSNNNSESNEVSTGSEMGIDDFFTALEDACSEESLKTINGIYKCHNKCQSHLCCFANNEQAKQDCSNERPKACSAYEPCKNLVQPISGDQSIVTLEPEDIEKIVFDACHFGADPLKITEQMVQSCHNVCASRLCCFSDYLLQSSCRASVGNDECELYSLCEQLVTSDGMEVDDVIDLREEEHDVAHLCTFKVNEDNDLYEACRSVCVEKRSCCFEVPDYSCYDMEKDWCDEFKACEAVGLNFNSLGGSDSTSISYGDNAAVDIEKTVYDACYFGNDESKVTQALVKNCHDVCKPRFCCFESYKLEGSCRATVGDDECELFALCEQLITDEGGLVKTFIELDLKEFDNNSDDTASPEDIEKEVYDACYFGTDESKITQELVTNCHKVCKPRLCCFGSYKLKDSCRASVGEEECELFSLCEQMISKDGGEVKTVVELDLKEFYDETTDTSYFEENEKAVYDACYFGTDESKVTQDLVDKCHAVCKPRFCCFESYKLESSCRWTLGDEECELFSLCEQLITKDGGIVKTFLELDLQEFSNIDDDDDDTSSPIDVNIEEQVYEACYFGNDESKVTQDLVNNCHDICKPRFCCFDSFKLESSCRWKVGNDECELFSLCEQLISDNGGLIKTFLELDMKEFDNDLPNNNGSSGLGNSALVPSEKTGTSVQDKVSTFISSLEESCSESSLKTLDGLQSCHNKCQTHLCCFTTDPKLADQNCSGLIPCDAYEPCKKLVNPSDPISSATSLQLSTREEIEKRVYDACYFGNDPTKVTEELVTKCHSVCAQRLCCFSDYSLQSSCRATIGDDECELYSLCDQLVTENGVVSDAIELDENEFDINGLCTEKVALDETLYNACKDTCERRSCCFESDQAYSCYSLEKAWCDEYKACEVIEYNFFDGSSSNAYPLDIGSTVSLIGDNSSSNNGHDLNVSIDSVCSADNFKTLEGIEQCFNKCQPYLCCFPEVADEMDWDCEDFRGEECSAYGSCEALVASHYLWKPPPKDVNKYAVKMAVNEACIRRSDAQPSEEWVSNCHQKCESRMCCLADPLIRSSCRDALGTEECNEYSACKVLIGGNSRDAEEIVDVCSNVDDASSFAKCEAKCKTRECCFEDTKNFSCYHLEKEWCDQFELCGMVGMTFSSSSDLLSSQGSQIISAPSPSQAVIPLSKPSFTPGTLNKNHGSDSSPVALPPVISTQPKSSEGDSDTELLILAKACNEEQLEIDATECRMLCKGSECCFTSHIENNCSRQTGMQAFCLAHMLCADLFAS